MTRPHIVRADTLDLQDHDQPSAQDHVQSPTLVRGSAPHQASELRHVQQERHSETEFLADQWGSGRSSHEGSELLEEDTDFLLEAGPDPHDHRHHHTVAQGNGVLQDSQDLGPERGVDDDDDDEDDEDGVDKISSSPSIEDEDIDFEFVYALHTFVATVEGQANATKGDTMVLLDDSNSYWWLVRVVKDSSIGYLPAEHIETPTERLARLNKHRNIDLAQSMLGDNPQQSKNPLKKAMRRRNAKMVQFTAPTYFEPPDNDWSDEDGEEEDGGDITMAERQDTEQEDERQEASTGEAEAINQGQANIQAQRPAEQADAIVDTQEQRSTSEPEKPSEAAVERITRNGTIRNTDSFFKDDTVEPRKISLTPNILRDGSNGNATTTATEAKDPPAASSQENIFDTLDRSNSTSSRDSKSGKKDKKPGMLSGLFKRKDKKIKVDEAMGGVVTKEGAADVPLSPSAIAPGESLSDMAVSPTSPTAGSRKIGPNKLAKPPPASAIAPNSNSGPARTLTTNGSNASLNSLREAQRGDASVQSIMTAANGSAADLRQPLNIRIPNGNDEQKSNTKVLSPLTSLVASDQPKKEKLKKAKTRMELDVDSSPETEQGPNGVFDEITSISTGPSPGRPAPAAPAVALQTRKQDDNSATNLYDDAKQSVPIDTQPRMTHSASSGESEEPHTPIMHQAQSAFGQGQQRSSATNGATSDSVGTPDNIMPAATADNDRFARDSWDGATLRTYLDKNSTNEVKDMLVIINDHTGVVPVSHDHPVMAELGLLEQQRKLDALSAQLDGLLQGFLEKRKATRAKIAKAGTDTESAQASAAVSQA